MNRQIKQLNTHTLRRLCTVQFILWKIRINICCKNFCPANLKRKYANFFSSYPDARTKFTWPV